MLCQESKILNCLIFNIKLNLTVPFHYIFCLYVYMFVYIYLFFNSFDENCLYFHARCAEMFQQIMILLIM